MITTFSHLFLVDHADFEQSLKPELRPDLERRVGNLCAYLCEIAAHRREYIVK